MIKYKEEAAEGRSKGKNIEKTKELLKTLPDKVPQIRNLEVGVDILHREQIDFDIVFISEYDNMEEIRAAAKHPAFVEFVNFAKNVAEALHSVTYEI